LYDKKNDYISQNYNLTYKVQQEQEWERALQETRNAPATIKLLTKYIQIDSEIGASDQKQEVGLPMRAVHNITRV